MSTAKIKSAIVEKITMVTEACDKAKRPVSAHGATKKQTIHRIGEANESRGRIPGGCRMQRGKAVRKLRRRWPAG
eukprot:1614224-Rhodomonas_salina.1